jgi:hypothetical protein
MVMALRPNLLIASVARAMFRAAGGEMTRPPTEAASNLTRKNGRWRGKVFGIAWLGARLSFLALPFLHIEAIFQPSDSMSPC